MSEFDDVLSMTVAKVLRRNQSTAGQLRTAIQGLLCRALDKHAEAAIKAETVAMLMIPITFSIGAARNEQAAAVLKFRDSAVEMSQFSPADYLTRWQIQAAVDALSEFAPLVALAEKVIEGQE